MKWADPSGLPASNRGVSRADVAFIGAGPAGLAPLVWAARTGALPRLAEQGLVVIDRQAPGAGALAEHAIGSDTLADTFLECLADGAEPRLCALASHPSARRLAAFCGGAAPLPVVAAFLSVLGQAMHDILLSHGARILIGHSAVQSRRIDGAWRTVVTGPGGAREILSAQLVIATGAEQSMGGIAHERVGGRALLPALDGRIMLSGEALAHAGVATIASRLSGRPRPRVAIIGGSHSALACANLLLQEGSGIAFAAGTVTVLHRRPLRIFYPSADAALAEGYADFTSEDVCPLTQRVFRLAGFRLQARALVRQALGIGDAAAEPRLHLHRLDGPADASAWRILDEAELVIAAFGYRPRAMRLLDADGIEIRLASHAGRAVPLVDRACRVIDASGHAVPGVFALGLAAGFVPSGALGGEPSFVGQTNGLWLWQNDVGAMIIAQLMQRESSDVAA